MRIVANATSADFLVNHLQGAVKIALADRLKIICRQLIHLFYGIEIPLADFYDYDQKERIHPEYPLFGGQPFKIRTVLQLIGTEIFRNLFYQSIWCQWVKEHYLDQMTHRYVIISDIRLPDEVQFFRNLESTRQIERFICLRIRRDNREQIDIQNQQHSTEQSIDLLPVDKESSTIHHWIIYINNWNMP